MKKILEISNDKSLRLSLKNSDPDKNTIHETLSNLFPQAVIKKTEFVRVENIYKENINSTRYIEYWIYFPKENLQLNNTIAVILLKEMFEIKDKTNDRF